MTLYTFAVMLDILSFGYIALTHRKTGLLKDVKFFRSDLMETFAIIPSIISAILILISPGGLVRNIITILLLQFVINHFIWGILVGNIEGILSNNRATKIGAILFLIMEILLSLFLYFVLRPLF